MQKTITAEMSAVEAAALAELVKRICWDEIRGNAVSDEEAYTMRDALERLRVGLAPLWILAAMKDDTDKKTPELPGVHQQIGYIRVSTVGQNSARQLDGMALSRVFEDLASGKGRAERPALRECIKYCRTGDVLHVHSMDRLARNIEDLRGIVRELNEKGVVVQFEKEKLSFSGDDSPMAVMLLSMLGAVAEFERSMIRERQREGIAVAKAKGVYTGRKPKLSPEKVQDLPSGDSR